ncbi:MAG: response regulator [Bdellovibrionota bacterium]
MEKVKVNNDFDLVLLDWEMPNLNGIDTLKLIREFNTDIAIIMVTTKNDPNLIAEAFEYGADEYVMKPFTKEILLKRFQPL